MTGTNHILTGMVIGAAVNKPVVVLPLALASHFALDALPHFDVGTHNTGLFLKVLTVDTVLVAGLVSWVVITQPAHWPLLLACGALAASPDLMWLTRWINELRHKPNKPLGIIARFHSRIQWFAKPAGIIFELPWALLMTGLLWHLT